MPEFPRLSSRLVSPVPSGTASTLNPRRRSAPGSSSCTSHLGRGAMHRFANSRVGSATADVARKRVIDIFITGARVGCKQHRCRHHLSRLAVSALRHLLLDPSLLDRMAVV